MKIKQTVNHAPIASRRSGDRGKVNNTFMKKYVVMNKSFHVNFLYHEKNGQIFIEKQSNNTKIG
ncbi:MAG: hypothetical protein KBG92_02925 [Spirochaetes bacterium]|nr:hypothetical protein [Spirochaetota bacterium]